MDNFSASVRISLNGSDSEEFAAAFPVLDKTQRAMQRYQSIPITQISIQLVTMP
jgi:hypothetical protein